MSPVLFNADGKSAHNCLFIYKGTPDTGTVCRHQPVRRTKVPPVHKRL